METLKYIGVILLLALLYGGLVYLRCSTEKPGTVIIIDGNSHTCG